MAHAPATVLDLNLVVAMPATAQVNLGFVPDEWCICNIGSTRKVYYSFDGVSTHGILTPGYTPAMSVQTKTQKLWLWAEAGIAAVSAHVMAHTYT